MIQELSKRILKNQPALDRWHQAHMSQLAGVPPPVYASLDLRNAGFKIAPVDTNLFPSGFNNLCETFTENGSQAFRDYFRTYYPDMQRLLIFPEEHTRNLYYWKNIASLQDMLVQAGFEVAVGSASTHFDRDPFVIALDDNRSVTIRKISLSDRKLQFENFVPDAILINNDLTSGIPEYLKGLSQVLLPSPHLGWHRRHKSDHFAHYDRLAREVSSLLDLDPWQLSTLTAVESGINLDDEICLKRLQQSADRLLGMIRQKYLQYGIRRTPYLFVKNNSGTYGLGIIHVDSGEKLLHLNRRLRNKLESSKGGRKVFEFLLQEGIPTADRYDGKPLEPVVYMAGGRTIGTFFRIHESKSDLDNLNTPGMSFHCLCAHKVDCRQHPGLTYKDCDQLFTVASLLGRIASLASMHELEMIGQFAAA